MVAVVLGRADRDDHHRAAVLEVLAHLEVRHLRHETRAGHQLSPTAFSQYNSVDYPVTFHYGSETVTDAYIHLKGDSSWQETVQYDGANGKMQVGIAFDHVNPSATFHGVSKIGFDMPRTDPTFLRFATAECLAYLQWVVRFADAQGLTDSTE